MSYVALIVTDSNVDLHLIKNIHNISGRSLLEIKKAINDYTPLAVVNMLKSTEEDEIKKFVSLLQLLIDTGISYQLLRKNGQIELNGKILGADIITQESFAKLLDRAKLIELQTQELVDREVGDESQ